MCVAVIVQSEKRIPKNYLKAMHEANPHGGGVAWIDGDNVQFRKGLTWEEIDDLQDRLPRPFLMHFRIATRGGKIPELTHPFPLGVQAFEDDLVGMSAKGVLIHNGTWPDYRKYLPKGLEKMDQENKISDTQTAAYMAAFDEDILKEVRWSNAIMKPQGVYYRGNWEEHEGNLYSNLYWRRELYSDYSDWRNWHGRSFTPHNIPDVRKKGDVPSHQQNRNQENGRTVGQYQTQFSKSGSSAGHTRIGKGLNTVQSNGKTLAENREAKRSRTKTQPMKSVTYEDAVKTYNDSRRVPRMSDNPGTNAATQGGPAWGSERLFENGELPRSGERAWAGYRWNDQGQVCKADTVDFEIKSRETVKLPPSVKCDSCQKEIETIPCPCETDNEEVALKDISVTDCMQSCGTCIAEDECTLIGFDELPPVSEDGIPHAVTSEGEGPVQLTLLTESGDMLDVEDMNAFGMSMGMDAMPGDDDDLFLNEDWKDINAAIRGQGVKITPSEN